MPKPIKFEPVTRRDDCCHVLVLDQVTGAYTFTGYLVKLPNPDQPYMLDFTGVITDAVLCRTKADVVTEVLNYAHNRPVHLPL